MFVPGTIIPFSLNICPITQIIFVVKIINSFFPQVRSLYFLHLGQPHIFLYYFYFSPKFVYVVIIVLVRVLVILVVVVVSEHLN